MCLSFEGVSKSASDGREASHLIYIKGKKGGLLQEGEGPCWKEGGRGSSEKKEAKAALLSQVPIPQRPVVLLRGFVDPQL